MPKKRQRRNPVPKAPPKRRFAGAPPATARQQSSALARVRRFSAEHERTERPFNPGKVPTWRGSSRDLVVNGSTTIKGVRLDEFTIGFLTTAIWSSNDESRDDGGNPLDDNYSIQDFEKESLQKLAADCERFQEENASDLAVGYESVPNDDTPEMRGGHDFWLTRNGHGAGFWDGDWPEPQAERLTDASEAFGEVNLSVNDGEIYADFMRPMARNARRGHRRNAEQMHFPFGSARAGAMLIDIPTFDWKQIDGDVDPCSYGGTIARADGDRIDLIKIQPTREYVGDKEAAEVGFPFWTREATYDLDDLQLNSKEVQGALSFVGLKDDPTPLEEATPETRALMIAAALMDYGSGVDEAEGGFSTDIVQFPVKWYSGEPQTFEEFCGDEDNEFRVEVLGEGYTYKIAYQIVTPESAEDGEAAENGWEVEGSDVYGSLEDVLNDGDIKHKSWIEWSDSHPDGKRSWLISDDDEDFRTGARTQYHLWIERTDEEPLSQDELREISRVLGVRMR